MLLANWRSVLTHDHKLVPPSWKAALPRGHDLLIQFSRLIDKLWEQLTNSWPRDNKT